MLSRPVCPPGNDRTRLHDDTVLAELPSDRILAQCTATRLQCQQVRLVEKL